MQLLSGRLPRAERRSARSPDLPVATVCEKAVFDRLLKRRIEDDDRIAVGRGTPAVADPVVKVGEQHDLAPREELESDVIGNTSAQLWLRPQEPVGVPVVCEDTSVLRLSSEGGDLPGLRRRPFCRSHPFERVRANAVAASAAAAAVTASGRTKRPRLANSTLLRIGSRSAGKRTRAASPNQTMLRTSCDRADHREQEGEAAERREPAPVAGRQPDGRERERVEGRGPHRRGARPPFVDEPVEQRIGQHVPVVAGKRQPVG